MKRFLPALLLLFCAPLAGCPKQNTAVEILQIAGIALTAGFQADGDSADAATYTKLSDLLIADVQNFTPGSSTQDAQQASTDLLNFLSTAGANGHLAGEIAIVINAVVGVVAIVTGDTSGTTTTPLQARAATLGRAPIKTRADFVKQWNEQLAAQPIAGLKPLK